MIALIIKTLQSGEFYGAGKCIEIAKGKNELVTDWAGIKRKIKRSVKARKL